MEMNITENTQITEPCDLPDPDVTAYSCWTYGDMEREFAEVFAKLTEAGCEASAAAAYAFGMINNLGGLAGKFERDRFSETLMARTVYYSFVLANDIAIAGNFPSRHRFEEYASLIEVWGDRHYKGLVLSAEDTEKLRTVSYSVLGGLTKRSLDEEQNGKPEQPEAELPPEQMLELMKLVREEMSRIDDKYVLVRECREPFCEEETESIENAEPAEPDITDTDVTAENTDDTETSEEE